MRQRRQVVADLEQAAEDLASSTIATWAAVLREISDLLRRRRVVDEMGVAPTNSVATSATWNWADSAQEHDPVARLTRSS